MSNVVDQRTVDFIFNNKEAIKNIETSIGAIDQFKKSLNFEDAGKSLDGFLHGLKSFDLGNVSKQLSGLDKSFTKFFKNVTNIFAIKEGIKAFDSLKNAVVSVTKSVTGLEQAQAGLTKYWNKTQAVQTIMAATGKSIDDVSAQLEKLNWYTDETSFNFVDMVENIGKFTSAGIDLEDSVRAMEGIANWASTSGRGTQEASRAMYNLAQAIGVGSVKLMDWKSIQNANMDTMEFKETVIETALELGNLKKVGEDYYTTIGKKQKVTAENFASTLSTGWFNSKLLIEVLNRYAEFTEQVYTFMDENPEFDSASKAMAEMRKRAEEASEAFDELGYKWFLSAQEAKTFKDAADAVKDAVSTGWMTTFEYFFGNYEQARKLWTDLANALYDTFAASGNTRNDFLYEVMTSGYHKLKKEIKDAGLSIEEFEKQIENSMKSTEDGKKSLQDLIVEYGNLSNALDAGQIKKPYIQAALEELIKTGDGAKKTVGTLEEVNQIIKDTWAGKYGNDKERFEAYEKLGYDAKALQKLVGTFTKKGKIELEDLEEVGIEVTEGLSESWKELIEANEDLIESLDKLSGRELIIGAFWNVFKGATGIISSVKEGFSSVFNISPDAARVVLENLYKITGYLNLSEDSLGKLKNFVTATVSPLKSMAVVGKRFVEAVVGNSIEKRLPLLQQKISNIFNGIYTYQRRLAKLFTSLETSAYVNKFIAVSSKAIRAFGSDTLNFFRSIRAGFGIVLDNSVLLKRFGSIKRQWDRVWKEVNTGGKNGLDTIIQAGKRFWEQWQELHPDDWNPIPSLIENLQTDFLNLKRWFRKTDVGSILSKYWMQIKTSFLDVKTKFDQAENPYVVAWDYLNKGLLFLKRKIRATKVGSIFSAKWMEIKKTFLEGKALFDKIRENPFSVVWDFFSKAMLDLKGKFRATKIGSFLSSIWMQIKNAFGKKDTKVKGSLSGGGLFENFLQNVELSFDYLKNRFKESWIGKKLQPVAEAFKAAYDTFIKKIKYGSKGKHSKSDQLTDKLADIDWQHITEGVKGSLINDRAMSYLQRIPQMFSKVKDRIVAEAVSLKTKIDSLWTSYKQTGFHKVLQDFWNWSRPLLKTLTEKLVNNFTYKDVSALFTSLAAFNLSKLSKNLGQFIKDFNKSFKEGKTLETITESLSSFFKGNSLSSAVSAFTDGANTITKSITEGLQPLTDAITGNLKAISGELKGRTVLEIAGAIALVSGSIWLLSKVGQKEGDLEKASIAIAAIAGSLAGLMLALNKVASTSFEPKAYGQIAAMALALLLISTAVRNLAKAAEAFMGYDWTQIAAGVGAVLALMLGSLETLHLFRFTNIKHSLSIVVTLIAVAAAIRLMAGAVKEIATLGWDKSTAAGVLGVMALIGTLAGAMALIGVTGGPLFLGSALAIFAMAGAVRILVKAVQDFAVISKNRDEFAKGISAVIGLIAALGASVMLSGLGPANLLGGTALSILAMAAAVRVLVNAVKEFAHVPEVDLEKSVDAISKLLLSLGGAVAISGITFSSIGKAATVFAFVAAIYALQNAVQAFANIPIVNLQKSIDAITKLISSLQWATFWSGFTLNGLGGAAAALGLAKAMQWIVEAVKVLAEISVNRDRLTNAIDVIKEMMATVAAITALLGAFNGLGMGVSMAQALTIVAMAFAVKVIGEALEGLAKVNSDRLITAGVVIGAIVFVLALLVGLMGRMSTEKIKGIGGAAMIAGFATAIKTISDSLIKLSEIDEEALKRGGKAIAQIMILLTGIVPVLSHFPITGNMKALSLSFLAFSAGIAIMAFAIEKLGGMDQGKLIQGGYAIAALMFALTAASALASVTAKVASFEGAATLVATAASAYILATAVSKLSDIPEKDIRKAATVMAALVVAVGVVGRFTKAAGSDIKSALSIAILAAAIAGLAFVAKTFADMEWPQLSKIAASLGIMVGAIAIMGQIVKVGVSSISIGAVAKLGIALATLVGILGALVIGLGAIYNIPGVDDLMKGGVQFMKELGRAIGGFIGAIVGGFREGVADSMPAVGASMAKFAENAEPFFQLLSKYEKFNPLESLQTITDALDNVIWSELLAKMFKLFSTGTDDEGNAIEYFKSLEAFGQGLAKLAPGFGTFIDSFREVEDLSTVETVTGLIGQLSQIATEQSYIITSGNVLDSFAAYIEESAGSFQTAFEAWNKIPEPTGSATKIVDFVSDLAGIELPDSLDFGIELGGFFKFWVSVKDSFTTFAQDLQGSTTGLGEFIDFTNGLTILYGTNGKTKAENLCEMLRSLASIPVPPSGGIFSWWKDYETAFTEFATDIQNSMGPIEGFIKAVEGSTVPDMEKVNNIIKIIGDMAAIERPTDPNQTGGFYQTYTAMVSEFVHANEKLTELADEIDTSKLDNISKLLEFFDGSKTVDTTFIDAVPKQLEEFSKELENVSVDPNLVSGLNSIVSAFGFNNDIQTGFFSFIGNDIYSGMNNIASSSGNLEKAKNVAGFISDFVYRVFRLQNDFNVDTFASNLDSMIQTLNQKFATLHDPGLKLTKLREFFESIKEMSDFEPGTFDPAGGISDMLDFYWGWLQKLSGLGENGEEGFTPNFDAWTDAFSGVAGIINSFTVDETKFNSIARFLELLQKEFISPKNKGLLAGKDKNYFEDIGEDLVKMDEKLGERDFTETTRLITLVNNFASALQRLGILNADKLKSKLVELVNVVNDAILGDGTEESSGAGDIGTILEPISTLFDTLQSYADSGLKNVVPDVLNGIKTAIDEFSYSPAQFDLIHQVLSQIAADVGLLDPLSGLPVIGSGIKGSLGATVSGGRDRISKVQDLVNKLLNKNEGQTSIFDSFIESVNNMEVDSEKADFITDIAESIENAAEGIALSGDSAFEKFVQTIADSIKENSAETDEAGRYIAEGMIIVFENFYDKFFEVGRMFVENITNGMRLGSITAMEMAATVATNIISRFDKTIEEGENSGEKFVNNFVEGILSEDSATLIQDAIKHLFTPDEGVQQEGGETFSAGRLYGEKFVSDFQQGLDATGDGLAMSLNTVFTSFGENFDLTEMAAAISGSVETVQKEVAEPISMINSTLSKAVPNGGALANAMIDGIIGTLQDRVEEACAEMSAFAGAVAAAARAALKIHSPSKVFYEIGEYVVEGFVQGINDDSNIARESIKELVSGPALRDATEMLTNFSEENSGFITRIFSNDDLDEVKSRLEILNEYVNETIPTEPKITPVVNFAGMKASMDRIPNEKELNFFGRSSELTSRTAALLEKNKTKDINEVKSSPVSQTFIQNNYSPKALSRIEIYRQTKNQFAQMKEMKA